MCSTAEPGIAEVDRDAGQRREVVDRCSMSSTPIWPHGLQQGGMGTGGRHVSTDQSTSAQQRAETRVHTPSRV